MNYQSMNKEVLGSVDRPYDLAVESVSKTSSPVIIYERTAHLIDEVRREILLLPPVKKEIVLTTTPATNEAVILNNSNRWINVFNLRKMMMKN